MHLLALVLAGHLIGDWIVQTDFQAANKVRPEVQDVDTRQNVAAYWRSWKANQQHMFGYHVTLAWALMLAGPRLGLGPLLAILGISWVTHSFIDRRWPVRWLCDHTGSSAFGATTFGIIAVDQALHLSILSLLVAATGR